MHGSPAENLTAAHLGFSNFVHGCHACRQGDKTMEEAKMNSERKVKIVNNIYDLHTLMSKPSLNPLFSCKVSHFIHTTDMESLALPHTNCFLLMKLYLSLFTSLLYFDFYRTITQFSYYKSVCFSCPSSEFLNCLVQLIICTHHNHFTYHKFVRFRILELRNRVTEPSYAKRRHTLSY